jgi:hypothetical protein
MMRVNVYAEEITDDIQPISKPVGGRTLYGLRFFLKSHPDLSPPHHPDDDRSAVTFWFTSEAERAALARRAASVA